MPEQVFSGTGLIKQMSEMVHHVACPLCSSTELVHEFTCTDHFLSGETFPVVKCDQCGFTFTQDHPGENEAGKYYESEDYISHSDTSKGLTNKLYRFARNFMLKRKVRLVVKVTGQNRGNLLDIGSGTGYFVNAMKNAGWKAEGIEINKKAREFSIAKFGIDVYDPSDLSNLKPGNYDCITLWHVLEHFHDPDVYMREIARLLKPGGRCIIALPNSNSYDARHYREFWAAWDVPRHLWHFTPETFRKFCEKSTFELTKISSLPLDVFYISTLSEKYRGSGFHFFKGIVKGKWLWILSAFNKKKASSLIYVLRAGS